LRSSTTPTISKTPGHFFSVSILPEACSWQTPICPILMGFPLAGTAPEAVGELSPRAAPAAASPEAARKARREKGMGACFCKSLFVVIAYFLLLE